MEYFLLNITTNTFTTHEREKQNYLFIYPVSLLIPKQDISLNHKGIDVIGIPLS